MNFDERWVQYEVTNIIYTKKITEQTKEINNLTVVMIGAFREARQAANFIWSICDHVVLKINRHILNQIRKI